MGIRANNTNGFFRRLYAGETEKVCLMKREPDQRAGVFRTVTLYGVRWDEISKTGEPLQISMTSSHRRALHIPREAMKFAHVEFISALDRFRDKEGRLWQPESTTPIMEKLFENMIVVYCLRCDDQFTMK
jgi:hypothetical protein